MKKSALLLTVIIMSFLAGACADPERYTPPLNPNPQIELCHVHITASYSNYEGEGWVVDQFHFVNGQDATIYVLMLYAGTDEMAYKVTLGHNSDRTCHDPYINKGSDLDVHIQYEDAGHNVVDCPDSPAYWGL